MINTDQKNEYRLTVIQWLKMYLDDDAMDYKMVKATARIEGFTRGELKAARRALNVKLITLGPEDYLWALPGKELPA